MPQVSLVAARAPALQSFATALVGKVAGAAVKVAPGAASAAAVAVSIGEGAPAGAHTAVTAPVEGATPALYAGASPVFVRAVLPKGANLPLRDAVDALPAAGIAASAELEQVKACFKKTATVAVAEAKAKNAAKVTLLVKQVTKYEKLNQLFLDALLEASEGTGVAVDSVASAQVANTLVMFPETVGVVAAADTQTAEVVEGLVAGLLGGVHTTYVSEAGKIAAGNSVNSVASAVAESLRSQGLDKEAAKVRQAIAKAQTSDGGKALMAAL